MFDIKSLNIKDFIILALSLLVGFLIYKYFTNSNKITELKNEINSMKEELNNNNKLIDVNKNTEYSDSSVDETINYKTNKTIETFNNNPKMKAEIECDEDMCFIKREIIEVEEQPVLFNKIQDQFYNKINNLANEVDNIIRSDVYIPIDLKGLINTVYESVETATNEILVNNIDFNPVIIETQGNINYITPHQIKDNETIEILNIPRNLNIPENLNIPQNLNIIEVCENNNYKEVEEVEEVEEVQEEEEEVEKVVQEKLNNLIEVCENNYKEEFETKEITEVENDIYLIDNSMINLNNNLESEKIKNLKINDIKNLAKKFNIKLTENSKPKNKDQLLKEINQFKSKNKSNPI
jgi:hypothetical protein